MNLWKKGVRVVQYSNFRNVFLSISPFISIWQSWNRRMDMLVKRMTSPTIAMELMSFTDNVPNADGLSPQKLVAFFTTVNSFF